MCSQKQMAKPLKATSGRKPMHRARGPTIEQVQLWNTVDHSIKKHARKRCTVPLILQCNAVFLDLEDSIVGSAFKFNGQTVIPSNLSFQIKIVADISAISASSFVIRPPNKCYQRTSEWQKEQFPYLVCQWSTTTTRCRNLWNMVSIEGSLGPLSFFQKGALPNLV